MTQLRETLKEKQTFIPREEDQARVISCEVKEDKIFTQLDDGREVIIRISSLTELGIIDEDVKPEQLVNYQLQNEGRYIFFPEADEILPAWIISKGLRFSCCD